MLLSKDLHRSSQDNPPNLTNDCQPLIKRYAA
jgi:hypothetical protein